MNDFAAILTKWATPTNHQKKMNDLQIKTMYGLALAEKRLFDLKEINAPAMIVENADKTYKEKLKMATEMGINEKEYKIYYRAFLDRFVEFELTASYRESCKRAMEYAMREDSEAGKSCEMHALDDCGPFCPDYEEDEETAFFRNG